MRDGEDAIRAIDEHQPVVAVIDLRMPGLSGMEVARRVVDRTRVILYTGHSDGALVAEALDAGVKGFVLKEAPLADVARAIQTVGGGSVYVDPVLAGVLASRRDERIGEAALAARARGVAAARRRPAQRGHRPAAAHRGRDGTGAHPQRDAQARRGTRTQAVATALRQSMIE